VAQEAVKGTHRRTRGRRAALTLVDVILLLLGLSACQAAPTPSPTPTAAATESVLATATNDQVPAEDDMSPTATPGGNHGLAVTLLEACSDGAYTTLRIHTELNAAYWGLAAAHFAPPGNVVIEAATIFVQDGLLFSTTSSGVRADPTFNPLRQVAQVEQTFVYPGAPTPGTRLELQAAVTLSNLPQNFHPPAPDLAFLEPGIIAIPARFSLPVIVGVCR
jgi:hypothetical protein